MDSIALTARPGYKMSEVQLRVESLLKRVHLIHPDDTQAVVKVNTEAMFGMIDSLFSGVSILVWMIGLGTLLAGAIGVSNIMIVTVKERTTEIGIRRAIGATPRDILTMVMSESVVLTLVAGMSGITMAVIILWPGRRCSSPAGFAGHHCGPGTRAACHEDTSRGRDERRVKTIIEHKSLNK